jgi:hypothetical protein
MATRLSLVKNEFGELNFFYSDLAHNQTGFPVGSVSDLFASALELFVTHHFPADDVCLRGGNLCLRDLDQERALLKFRAAGYPEIFCTLGTLFAQCRLSAGPLSEGVDAFFDVPWECYREPNGLADDEGGEKDDELLAVAFQIYESFTVCECFLLDLAAEAFLGGIHVSQDRLNRQTIQKIISGTPKYRLSEHEDITPRAFWPKALSLPPEPRQEPAMEDPFRMPLWASGWHSGWDEKQKDPCAALALGNRRTVHLTRCAAERTVTLIGNCDVPPFLLKTARGTIRGLSSGAGGALVPWRGNIVKLKRCGLKNEGIFLDALRDRHIRTASGRLLETTITAAAGLAPLPVLERETEVVRRLPAFGLEAASEPCAMYVVAEGQAPSGCLMSSVKTDLRVDEVLYGLARNHGGLLSRADIHELVHELGAAEGALYSSIRHSGMVRGVGNSWYGNEALDSNGTLLLCDLETFFFPDLVTPELSRFHCSHQTNFFHMAVWRSLAMLGEMGRDLTRRFLRAFQEVYGRRPGTQLSARGCAEWVQAVAARAEMASTLPGPAVEVAERL